ncbi:unnamed protein product [Rotaria sp. Silwood1]|nr:unnamed protein product [Rotaria sp. Silwood1]
MPMVKNQLANMFENFVYQTGIEDPKVYVEIVVGIYEKFLNSVNDVFRNKRNLNVALDKTCWKFINQNPMTDENRIKSVELLVKYCHKLLIKCEDLTETNININYKIQLVNNYESDKIQVSLNIEANLNEITTLDNVQRTIDDDRKIILLS